MTSSCDAGRTRTEYIWVNYTRARPASVENQNQTGDLQCCGGVLY